MWPARRCWTISRLAGRLGFGLLQALLQHDLALAQAAALRAVRGVDHEAQAHPAEEADPRERAEEVNEAEAKQDAQPGEPRRERHAEGPREAGLETSQDDDRAQDDGEREERADVREVHEDVDG